jgi:aminoglycoside phosphotransferase (APT) family kinase protein
MTPPAGASYVLQQLNPDVFTDPALVMQNIARVTAHLAEQRRRDRTRRETLELTPTTAGDLWLEEAGRTWRMYRFIGGAHMRLKPATGSDAREAARAFGEFVALLADLTGPPLHTTIPGFHDTSARIAQLEDAVRRDPARRATSARAEIDAALAEADLAGVLPPLIASGDVPTRTVHNDAKLANVLLDDTTGAARCVIDLDTVMPGALLNDFGDMVRSMTTPTDEDESDLTSVGVKLPLFEAVATGFLEGAGAILAPREPALLVHAGLLITYEQAVRFLADDLEGDAYYRVSRPRHNLARARTQLKHFETLKTRRAELEAIIGRLARS